jgi:hypothetical protein
VSQLALLPMVEAPGIRLSTLTGGSSNSTQGSSWRNNGQASSSMAAVGTQLARSINVSSTVWFAMTSSKELIVDRV